MNNQEKKEFIQATGRRKTAVAQIRFFPNGSGKILINQKKVEDYFPYFVWQKNVYDPLELTNFKNGDFIIKVTGGGINAQAEAIRLGISRALVKYNPDFKKILKSAGFLTRDPREKERKKPGLKRARRAPQWQKR
jgi:small subunit ribosomal protein S9